MSPLSASRSDREPVEPAGTLATGAAATAGVLAFNNNRASEEETPLFPAGAGAGVAEGAASTDVELCAGTAAGVTACNSKSMDGENAHS